MGGKDGKEEGKDGKEEGKAGKEEGKVFQATLHTNEYEGSEGLIKMIAVIGNASKKRCEISIINVPMKMATINSVKIDEPSIDNEKKTMKAQSAEDFKELKAWRKNHGCNLDDTGSSCKIEGGKDLKDALDNAPWYFRKGGSLPMLKIEKNN